MSLPHQVTPTLVTPLFLIVKHLKGGLLPICSGKQLPPTKGRGNVFGGISAWLYEYIRAVDFND